MSESHDDMDRVAAEGVEEEAAVDSNEPCDQQVCPKTEGPLAEEGEDEMASEESSPDDSDDVERIADAGESSQVPEGEQVDSPIAEVSPEDADACSSKEEPGGSSQKESHALPVRKMAIGVALLAAVGLGAYALLGGGKTSVVSKVTVDSSDGFNSDTFEFSYNGQGYLEHVKHVDSDLVETDSSYTYDGSGHLVEGESARDFEESSVVVERGADGITSISRVDFESTRTLTKATYEDGRLTKTVEKDDDSSYDTTRKFSYDKEGRVSKISAARGSISSSSTYQYDDKGRVVKISVKDDDGDPSGSSYRYDDQERLLASKDWNDSRESDTRYSYDDEGRLTKKVDQTEWSGDLWRLDDTKEVTKYEYDEKDRLVRLVSIDEDDEKTIVSYEWNEKGDLARMKVSADGSTMVFTMEYEQVKKNNMSHLYVIDPDQSPDEVKPWLIDDPEPSVSMFVLDGLYL